MPTPLELHVTQLVVNPENYRFEPVESQVEAIEMMVDGQGEKLFNIAKSVLERGSNPNDWPMVSIYSHDTSQYLVLEGNRRITALKILNNIDLLDDEKHQALKSKFKKMLRENTSNIPNKIWCNVYDNPTDADFWIKLKHSGENEGIGTVGWGNQGVLRYAERVEGVSALPLQVIDLLKSSKYVDNDLKKNLKNIKSSTLTRIVGDKDIKVLLGIYTNNGILQTDLEEKEVVKGLTQVARDLLKQGFTVNNVYTKEDRKDYISQFPIQSLPDKSKKAKHSWQLGNKNKTNNNISDSDKNKPKDQKPISPTRNVLIPKSCKIAIINGKVNDIYFELRNSKLHVKEFKNCVAVTFRVFVELSVDTYLEHNKIISAPTASGTHNSLQQKVLAVTKDMHLKGIDDGNICKGIIHAVKKDHDLLGLDNWHAYVHNNTFSPDPEILIKSWDNVEKFFTVLWDTIK